MLQSFAKSLFGSSNDSIEQSDTVMLLTPHVVRTHELTAEDLAPIYIGTQSNISLGGPPPLIAPQPDVPPVVGGVTPAAPNTGPATTMTPPGAQVGPGAAPPGTQPSNPAPPPGTSPVPSFVTPPAVATPPGAATPPGGVTPPGTVAAPGVFSRKAVSSSVSLVSPVFSTLDAMVAVIWSEAIDESP